MIQNCIDLPALVKRLQSRGFSQREIAQRANCSQPTVTRVVKGQTANPGFQVVDALRAFDLETAHMPVVTAPAAAEAANAPEQARAA